MTTRSVTEMGKQKAVGTRRKAASPAAPPAAPSADGGKRITARLSVEDVAVLAALKRKTGIQRDMEVLRMGLRALAEKLGV